MGDSVFRDAIDTLKGLEMASRQLARDIARKCDWDDPEDKRVFLQELRAKRRESALNRLVPTRICPVCGKCKTDSRKWVLSTDEGTALCRSCWYIGRIYANVEKKEICLVEDHLFPKEIPYYEVNGPLLKELRKKSGITQREFAESCGWSLPTQVKLEQAPNVKGTVNKVSHEKAILILDLLRAEGVITLDVLVK